MVPWRHGLSDTPPLDVTACDREPIHIPGSIQPYGLFFTLNPQTGRVAQVSLNVAERLNRPVDEIIGRTMEELVVPVPPTALEEVFEDLGRRPSVGRMLVKEVPHEFSVHVSEGILVLELEPEVTMAGGAASRYREARSAIADFRATTTLRQLAESVARNVRSMAGFDRVMVYRFLEDGTGMVFAEDRRQDLDSWLGLHYPASDIPKQARALYVRNPLRLIHDVSYTPSPIYPQQNPMTGLPLDMSQSVLRSVSPIHVQYLKNMGVGASMSISLVRNGVLWGLVACHNETPWQGGSDLRAALELIGQAASLQIGELEARTDREFRDRAWALQDRLVDRMVASKSVSAGLSEQGHELLDLVNSTGAAVVHRGKVTLIGATPNESQVRRLVAWLRETEKGDTFQTDALSDLLPGSAEYAPVASGVLAVANSRRQEEYVIWFRPEVVRTVTWAGDPNKPTGVTALNPRTSFAEWQETKRGRSRAWTAAEARAAADLRVAILESEVHALNAELEIRVQERTAQLQKAVDELNGFTYSVSHDLRTPLRGMIGHSRIIIEEHAASLTPDIRQGLMKIEAAALKMGDLVEGLLQFARLGRQEVSRADVDLSGLASDVAERLAALGPPCGGLQITIQPGLRAQGDPRQLEILLTTLLDNGCKYRNPDQTPEIEIGRDGDAFFVRNVGVGFEMEYVDKLFQPFHRLHVDGEYPGTGIGLANAKRIVERHHGRIWAEGRPGDGATFYFTLG
ncbi:GAF domain-containing protein [bacterium]|nr:MAG: GAF domain-containing protein [bacterium]